MRTMLTTLAVLMLLCVNARAEALITEAEASAPSGIDASLNTRGMTRGPTIDQIEPNPAAGARSPLELKVKFTAHNDAKIDPATMKVSYVKLKPVDLTERLRKYTTSDGIDMPDAEVPPGTHLLRLEIKDTLGRTAVSLIKLLVQ